MDELFAVAVDQVYSSGGGQGGNVVGEFIGGTLTLLASMWPIWVVLWWAFKTFSLATLGWTLGVIFLITLICVGRSYLKWRAKNAD